MMASVTRGTSSAVHFWLLDNFLSAPFKRDIPALSSALGCRVHLVRYGWPRWLRSQTERQREIWGYKVRLLDILFINNDPLIMFYI